MSNSKKDNEEVFSKVSINWYPGHMAKTKRQIIEDLKLIDVVIELLDARIPIASRNPDFDSIAKNKKRIVILNKSDLANDVENKNWIEYFKNKGIIAVEVDSNSGKGVDKVPKEIEKIMYEDISKMREKGIIRKTIRVMILGIPNVGKSSFINRISKKATMKVGNRPGVTRQKQWIRIGNQIELLDTPGVLWPKFDSEEVALNLSYIGTIKDEILDKTEIAFFLLKFLLQNYKANLLERYKLQEVELQDIMENIQNPNEQIMEVLYLIGKKRGAIVSGGNVDEEKASNILLDDFRTGKLGKISLEKVK